MQRETLVLQILVLFVNTLYALVDGLVQCLQIFNVLAPVSDRSELSKDRTMTITGIAIAVLFLAALCIAAYCLAK